MPSSATPRNPLASLDWILLSILLAIMGLGWVSVFAAGYGQGYPEDFSDWLLQTESGKQTIFFGVSLVILLCTLIIEHRFWRNGAMIIYIGTLLLLLGVLFFGKEIKGARSWYPIGGFSLQPSEFAKFGATLAVAAFLSGFRGQIRNIKAWIYAAGLFLAPAILILLQPDAGSALVFFGLSIVLYRAGLNGNLFVVGFLAAAALVSGLVFPPSRIALVLLLIALFTLVFQYKKYRIYAAIGLMGVSVASFYYLEQPGAPWYLPAAIALSLFIGMGIYWYRNRRSKLVFGLAGFVVAGTAIAGVANYLFNNVLAPHQQDRLNVWLQPAKCDPRGSLYNVLQSKMAIGSGGFQGKGFLDGTLTRLNYVPEQTTDFIFCTIGEEHGFLGVFLIIGLFTALLIRLVQKAERQKLLFNTYYMYGVAGILFVHFLLNIGMTMGLMPIIGIPLPFVSYGGSSLIAFTIIMGVALRLDAVDRERP